jgi:hypothetical protein
MEPALDISVALGVVRCDKSEGGDSFAPERFDLDYDRQDSHSGCTRSSAWYALLPTRDSKAFY